jgi:hypothetical protein
MITLSRNSQCSAQVSGYTFYCQYHPSHLSIILLRTVFKSFPFFTFNYSRAPQTHNTAGNNDTNADHDSNSLGSAGPTFFNGFYDDVDGSVRERLKKRSINVEEMRKVLDSHIDEDDLPVLYGRGVPLYAPSRIRINSICVLF